MIQDREDAYQGKFPDARHDVGCFPTLHLSLADAEELGEIFLQKAVGGAQRAEFGSGH